MITQLQGLAQPVFCALAYDAINLIVRIDHSIHLNEPSTPPEFLQRVLKELTIINPGKERALAELIRGAGNLPDEIVLWRRSGRKIIIPRGFVHRFEQIAEQEGIDIEWDSRMTLLPPSEHCFRDWPAAELRDYQIPARDAMLDWSQGVLEAPTGSGKTRICLEFVRWAGQKTLVIVGKVSLARQWQAVVQEVYGYETGFIGEGQWDERDLTIALWQSLHRKSETGSMKWGCVIVDEVHHCAADSLSNVTEGLDAFYRFGCSATPRWDPLLFPIIEASVGPIIHRILPAQVGSSLISPTVRVIETDFAMAYKATIRFKGRRQQNNFAEIMAALVADPARNDLLAKIARDEALDGHHVLIVTRRIEHVRQLVSRLESDFDLGNDLNVLTGAQTGADARRIAHTIDQAQSGTILVSTVAEEALDFPKLDRLIMAYPLRRLPLIEQQVGRILRPVPRKESATVYDIADPKTSVLRAQRTERMKLYARRGWKIRTEES